MKITDIFYGLILAAGLLAVWFLIDLIALWCTHAVI